MRTTTLSVCSLTLSIRADNLLDCLRDSKNGVLGKENLYERISANVLAPILSLEHRLWHVYFDAREFV